MYKHVNGLLKIAEYVEGNVSMIMETHTDDSAMVFMFTENKDFKLTIG